MTDNSKVKKIIRDEISQWAIDLLKKGNEKPIKTIEETPEEYLIKKQKIDSDAHNAVFFGFDDEESVEQSKQRYLKESDSAVEDTQILSSEITKFKQDMSSNVSSKTIFDNQQNNHVIYAYNGSSGIEVVCSGFIPLNSENKIKWQFSLQNGPYVEVNSELNSELTELLSSLSGYYDSWNAEWSAKFS